MKKNYDAHSIKQMFEKYDIGQFFDNTDLPFYIIQYEKGEFLQQPYNSDNLFQIGISGEVSIYHIRNDGEKYFLSYDKNLFKIGSVELVIDDNLPVYAEAVTDVTVIALSLDQNKEALLSDNKFLRVLLNEMAEVISFNMNYKAVSSSLPERVINYMKYSCTDNILCGIEKTAFQLHCSGRQLQRVLNDLESKNRVKKCGKGTYSLLLESCNNPSGEINKQF